MKKFYALYISLIFLFVTNSFSQQIKLTISSKDSIENTILKKLNFQDFILDKSELENRLDSITNRLHLYGFFNLESTVTSSNDSILNVIYNLKKQFKKIKINNLKDALIKSEISTILKTKINDTFEIDTQTLPVLFSKLIQRFEEKGESFTQFSLKNITLKSDFITAEIFIKKSNTRTIDGIVVKGYTLFPKTFIKHHLNLKKKMIFNKNKLNEVSNNLKSISFAEEIKKPQILFTKDSTLIYLYLKKKNSNRFDGLIGFNSKEDSNGLEFNGYLDLYLENMFNYGSEINLLWKNNGEENQKFNLAIKTPYLFNSAFSPKGFLEIYKQDLSHINIKTQFEIEYTINSKNKIATSIQNEISTNLLDNNTDAVENYNTTFYGLHYSYQSFSNTSLFPIKFYGSLNTYFGNRTSEKIKTSQTKLAFTSFYNWQLNYKNYLYTQINSGYLISDDYLDNELFRIGGNETVRGFQEESIFVSLYNIINIEYRYLTKNNSYFYSITDMGLVETQTAKNRLFGFGLGYAFETKIGLLNLNYVLGKSENQSFDFSKAVVGLKYITTF
ncbi:MAG: hypothetical protein L3J23_00420 [Flavobacteriaceae bacterium]|nr:hypothetical protein [Flavobacteriaceae bacterium]